MTKKRRIPVSHKKMHLQSQLGAQQTAPPRAPHRAQPTARKGEVVLYLTEMEISWEPMPDERILRLPAEVQDTIAQLHDEVKSQPRKAIGELHELIKKYPDIPQFYNFLTNAYQAANMMEEVETIALATWRRFPDYLFGRTNYAGVCLARGDLERIPEIFDNKFDLTMLYPGRKVFHISEVTGFMGIIGLYYAELGELENAEQYYGVLKEVAPDHPTTRRLGQVLHPGPLR